MKELREKVLTEKQKKTLENELAVDSSYSIEGFKRFRLNVFFQRGNRHGGMEGHGRPDNHGLNIGSFQHFLVIRVGFGCAGLSLNPPEALLVGIA